MRGSFGPSPVLARDRAISSSLIPRDLSPSLPAVHDKTFPFSDHVFSISHKRVFLRVFAVALGGAAMNI